MGGVGASVFITISFTKLIQLSIQTCLKLEPLEFCCKAFEEDVYSATGSLRTYTDRALHVGQVLSTDYNMFVCLLTLCELCKDLPS